MKGTFLTMKYLQYIFLANVLNKILASGGTTDNGTTDNGKIESIPISDFY